MSMQNIYTINQDICRTKQMKKIFQTPEEAASFILNMPDHNKYAFDFYRDLDGNVVLQWIEYKQYTAVDGKVFNDEIWITEDNQMHCVQDLEPEHCRNIIRMMIRNSRESERQFRELIEGALGALVEDNPNLNAEESLPDAEPQPRILH